jgi:hypothetical protein
MAVDTIKSKTFLVSTASSWQTQYDTTPKALTRA